MTTPDQWMVEEKDPMFFLMYLHEMNERRQHPLGWTAVMTSRGGIPEVSRIVITDERRILIRPEDMIHVEDIKAEEARIVDGDD